MWPSFLYVKSTLKYQGEISQAYLNYGFLTALSYAFSFILSEG